MSFSAAPKNSRNRKCPRDLTSLQQWDVTKDILSSTILDCNFGVLLYSEVLHQSQLCAFLTIFFNAAKNGNCRFNNEEKYERQLRPMMKTFLSSKIWFHLFIYVFIYF